MGLMNLIIIIIIFLALLTAIIFYILKMVQDQQLKKIRRNYDESKNESRPTGNQDDFKRDSRTDKPESIVHSPIQPKGRIVLQNDATIDTGKDEPECLLDEPEPIRVSKPKKTLRRIFGRRR